MKESLKIGASVAISWAWGTSLILGMQIAQTKGVEAFGIWAFANTVTLGIFGLLYKAKIITERLLEYRFVHWVTLLIQAFCLVIQLKILNEVLLPVIGDASWTYALVSAIGLFFVGIMWKRGLHTSIWTDNWQGAVTILALVLMLGVSVFSGASQYILPSSDSGSLMWGAWSACILLSGIITDLQHWQRAKANGNGFAFEFATLFFGIYMSLVFALAHYEIVGINRALLIVAVLGVTTSTIDSIAVAMHRLVNRTVGTVACFAICLAWGFLLEFGVVEIWSHFGIVRVGLACAMLYLGVRQWRALK